MNGCVHKMKLGLFPVKSSIGLRLSGVCTVRG